MHHGRILFLEALVQALRALEVLVNAAHHAALLAVDEGLGCEVVDAVVEAALDELGVHLHDKNGQWWRLEKIAVWIGMVCGWVRGDDGTRRPVVEGYPFRGLIFFSLCSF